LALPVCAEETLSNALVLANLLDIMFGSEFVGEDWDSVRKWTAPMRVAIYATDPDRYRPLVEPHLDLLRHLTGLDIRLVADSAPDQNLYILMLGRSQFYSYAQNHLRPGKSPQTNTNLACFGFFHADNSDRIDQAFAVIPRDISDDEIRYCIVEEVTQNLGLPNDSSNANPTVFNDDEKYEDLTWQDQLFLRVLYDPRVRPGMSRAEFEPLARRILAELRPGP
jgi:hypothetical protein